MSHCSYYSVTMQHLKLQCTELSFKIHNSFNRFSIKYLRLGLGYIKNASKMLLSIICSIIVGFKEEQLESY